MPAPQTIADNAQATIGCYSSLARICESVDYIEATASSHQRAFVIEVMGRHCGWLALMAGIATGADFIFIPENPPAENWREEMCSIVKKHRTLGKRKTIVIVAEGAHDRDLTKITATEIKDLLAGPNLKLDTRITTLGHVQRGGQACAYDRMLSTLQGADAVNAVLEATPETPSPVICIVENQIVRRPLLEAVAQTQQVAKAIEQKDFAQAMSLRDAEFSEYMAAYNITTSTDKPEMLLPEEKRMRIGIIHVGAPAGGMNAATRAAVAYCLARGHTPIALHNGFPGLCRHHDDKPVGSVAEFNWLEAEGWASKGGSEIGTNRNLPSDDFETTAFCFKKYVCSKSVPVYVCLSTDLSPFYRTSKHSSSLAVSKLSLLSASCEKRESTIARSRSRWSFSRRPFQTTFQVPSTRSAAIPA